jgi:hypothetical protein
MSSASLTPEQRAELDRLREELRNAELRAAEALRSLGPDHILEGEALTRFEEADHEISEIRHRIKELEGND